MTDVKSSDFRSQVSLRSPWWRWWSRVSPLLLIYMLFLPTTNQPRGACSLIRCLLVHRKCLITHHLPAHPPIYWSTKRQSHRFTFSFQNWDFGQKPPEFAAIIFLILIFSYVQRIPAIMQAFNDNNVSFVVRGGLQVLVMLADPNAGTAYQIFSLPIQSAF